MWSDNSIATGDSNDHKHFISRTNGYEFLYIFVSLKKKKNENPTFMKIEFRKVKRRIVVVTTT